MRFNAKMIELFILEVSIYLFHYQSSRGFDHLLQMTFFQQPCFDRVHFLVRFAGLVTSNDFFIPAPLSSTSHLSSGR